jgi:hypothetical protein
MGLYDRDYMRNEGGRPNRSGGGEDRAEDLASAFVRKHRRVLMVGGIILALLIIGGLILALAS